MSGQIGYPAAPVVDATGNATPVWQMFFLSLLNHSSAGAGGLGSLQNALAAEVRARAQADQGLSADIADAEASVDAEATTRQAADGQLQAAINQEAAARTSATANGTTNLSVERDARVAADTAEADARAAADVLLAPLASPVFTGNARAVTPAPGDNDTSVATTAFVAAAIASALAPLLDRLAALEAGR
jgi:hypothetical protein